MKDVGRTRPRWKLAVVLLLLLTSLASMVPAQPPASGDWTIDGHEAVENDDITMDGDLIILDGGNLVLDNVTLRLDADQGGDIGIWVQEGGELLLSESRIISGSSGKGFTFLVEGTATLIETGVEGLWGTGDDDEPEGLVVSGGDLTMEGSWIESARGTGLYLDAAKAEIIESDIVGSGGSGIHIIGPSSSRFERINVRDNGGHGMLIEESASPEVLDCEIANNDRNGVQITEADAAFADNRILNNEGHGISSQDSRDGIALDGDTITGNRGWGVLSMRGAVIQSGVIFEEGPKINLLGRLKQSWGLGVEAVGVNNEPKVGAEVSVKSKSGAVIGPITTDVAGFAYFENLIATKIDNEGVATDESPYEVTVVLKGTGWSVTEKLNVDLTGNLEVTVTVDLANIAMSNAHVSKDTFTKGEKVEISVVVTNIGGADPGSFTVTFYDGSKVLGKKEVNGLEPGASREVSIKWDTSDVTTGDHKIRIVSDAENKVPETNETNNEISTSIVAQERALTTYAIPILIIIGVLGLAGFKIYNWALLKRLERKQKAKGLGTRKRRKKDLEEDEEEDEDAFEVLNGEEE